MHRARATTAEGGYTLMEMLTVLAVLAVIVAIPVLTTTGARRDALLETGEASALQALKTARSRASAGVGTGSHGVHVETDRITVFEGESFGGAGTEYVLPPEVEASATGGDIVFTRLSATTSADATLTLTDSRGEARTISVTEHGFVE